MRPALAGGGARATLSLTVIPRSRPPLRTTCVTRRTSAVGERRRGRATTARRRTLTQTNPPPPPPSFLHSIPHGLAECRSEWAAVRRTWAARRDLPLSEAGMYALFAGEVFAWFCVGEIVGRGFTFGGYAV